MNSATAGRSTDGGGAIRSGTPARVSGRCDATDQASGQPARSGIRSSLTA